MWAWFTLMATVSMILELVAAFHSKDHLRCEHTSLTIKIFSDRLIDGFGKFTRDIIKGSIAAQCLTLSLSRNTNFSIFQVYDIGGGELFRIHDSGPEGLVIHTTESSACVFYKPDQLSPVFFRHIVWNTIFSHAHYPTLLVPIRYSFKLLENRKCQQMEIKLWKTNKCMLIYLDSQ